jgi:capsular exopolysaccharide synthesis family protein
MAIPDRATLPVQLLLGALGGLAVGFLILMLIDRLDDRLASFSELQELFDEEVLSQIPHQKGGGRGNPVSLIVPGDERYSFIEAYRNLRSSLLFMAKPGESQPKVILLTSSIPNEGKSLTCANLSIMLASSGARVLLIDADLRKGTLHHRFQVPAEPGLTEVVSEGVNWQEIVRPTSYSNVFLLTRGAFTGKSSELFIGASTGKFLKEAANNYDFVVIDTPPVMAADDVASLAPHVDAVVFVIRAEMTSARVARAALDLLYQRQAPVLGLVFNGVRPTSVDYYYYYK